MGALVAAALALLLALPLPLLAGDDAPVPSCCETVGSDCHREPAGPAFACCGSEVPAPVAAALVRTTGDSRPLPPLPAGAPSSFDASAAASARAIAIRHRQHAPSASAVIPSVLRI